MGGSRASLRREKRKAKANGDAHPPKRVKACEVDGAPSLPAAAAVVLERARAVDSAASPLSSAREWQIPTPTPDTDDALLAALHMAVEQAATIHGRKYRYGALLIAGEDHVPLKSGSNKKPFLRDNIHAEMSVLKGCPRPAGKDMLIARLAPCAPEPGRDSESESFSSKPERRKILNARPCERCEAKMVSKGIRRCYFTINASSIGVLEYNPDS
ncbi:hypothetical protein AB1Y20_003138 [Prymnesium parvum]|uniref:CMP/dCMP-type deaminase domain-containing protein n=1 Tax=Prymnesium parvum TaxID=97485 RepID=A0AB34JBC7_PRYPA